MCFLRRCQGDGLLSKLQCDDCGQTCPTLMILLAHWLIVGGKVVYVGGSEYLTRDRHMTLKEKLTL